jgi:prepilin-type N-terminal cleavage/methylation domain-containing protein
MMSLDDHSKVALTHLHSPAVRKERAGFTLIELLIVVAIIVILASIAVSNFLEAQVRSKVSRAQSDLRMINTALEAYRVDTNKYPPTPLMSLGNRDFRLHFLTTPVAYMTTIPHEIFTKGEREGYAFWSANLNDAMKVSPIYYHLTEEKNRRGRWVLFSRGPDIDYEAAIEEGGGGLLQYYDPTNGTVSNGDLMRFGP